MAADPSAPVPHLPPHLGHRGFPHPSMQAPGARVTGVAAQPRPAVRPDTSRQENGGCGRGWETGRKLGLAAPPHPPHAGGGNAGSKTRGRGQERTSETRTADNAGSGEGKEGSF